MKNKNIKISFRTISKFLSILIAAVLVAFPFATMASVDMNACVKALEETDTQNYGVVLEESGQAVPADLNCKIKIKSQKEGVVGEPCEVIINYEGLCLPMKHKYTGGACCPG